jgi:sugar lactone lactonase YvrE
MRQGGRVRAQQLTDVITDHGEGPVWDPHAGVLRCVDLLAGAIVTLADDGPVDRLDVGRVAAAWRPRTAGGLVVAVERGFRLVAADGRLGPVTEVFDDGSVRMNDGGCDHEGRFYCGSMGYDERPGAGTLWRLDPDGSTHRVLDGVTISNGLVWTGDGTGADNTAYYIDTPTHRVDTLRFDERGELVERAPLFEVTGTEGSPDGMTLDAEGGLWVALWGGRAVHRYTPDGTLAEVVDVGPAQVTACTFGGPDYDRLYITTSRTGLGAAAEPGAGAVYVVEPGVIGGPPLPFAG